MRLAQGRSMLTTLRSSHLLALVIGIAGILSNGQLATAASSAESDQLLVQPKPGITRQKAESVYRANGAELADEIPQIGVHVLRVPAQALGSVEKALSHRPEFQFVERNKRLTPALSANDPSYSSEWHLTRISAPGAWDVTTGSPDVVVAILDSGIDPAHPDLA